MRAKRFNVLPIPVLSEAHRLYPNAVGAEGLYCAAFFGHSAPHTIRTTESVWRGLVRKCLRDYVKGQEQNAG